jgi:restriction system protein
MKWKMAENSLFAILLRSQWWVSVLVAAGVFAAVRLFIEWGYALFATTPFVVIAAMAAWRQIRTPQGARLENALEKVRDMSWEAFARALEEGFRREGYTVKRVAGAADFELEKAGRASLVCARRWKAKRTGAEPLKELVAAGEKRGAQECVYVVAGEMTEQARGFAKEKLVRLVEEAGLVRLTKV